jgi:phage terminase large subunit-like protein
VLEGVVKREDLFAIIYTLDEDDDWKDEKVWVKSMPSLGYTVRVEEIRTKARAAATQTSQLNSFLTKNMNIWLSSQTAWIDDETWMLCDKGLVDPKILEGCPCWAGMDLSWKSDYTALVLLFDLGGELVLQSHFWATENELKSVEDVFDVWQWVNGGHLNVHEGDLLNYEVMGEEMGEILLRYQPQRIGFDPAAFSALYQKLLQLGVNGQVFDKVIQGTLSMTPGIQALETAIRNQEVNHQGHPVLRWMVQNVELYSDGKGLINFRKGSNNALKIDGCHGAAMAFEAKRRVEIQEVPDEPLSYTPRILPGHLNF